MAKKNKKNKNNVNWIIKVTLITFLISFFLSGISELLIPNLHIIFGITIVIIFILLGVLFDMIGVAITSASEKPFHAKSAKKVKGAKTAVKLLKNADRVSSFCNDVIGDICGIISGALSSSISLALASKLSINLLLITLLITGFVAALTIGGKAFGKSFAINKSNIILYQFSKVVSIFYRK